jgi:hypothetical protein
VFRRPLATDCSKWHLLIVSLGNQVILTSGPRRIAIFADEPTAAYDSDVVRCESVVVSAADLPGAGSVRAGVEILRQGGGLAPRALLGGSFTHGHGDLVFEVRSVADAHQSAQVATCRSQLWKPLIPGLPTEFADSVIDGLIRRPVPTTGRLVVDRAGYDHVESSPLAFELAAELLARVLAAMVTSAGVESIARDAMQAWP